MDDALILKKTLVITGSQVDCFGRLRPSALLEILQEAATDHAKLLGVGKDQLDPQGLFWAIARQTVEIHRMPGLGESLVVETWPGPSTRASFPRYITGSTPGGEVLFQAVALWLFMDRQSRAMVLPGASGVNVPCLLRGNELSNPGGIAPRDYPNVENRRVRYSELDCNGHLSNTKYLNWMEDLLPSPYHRDHMLSKLHICYLNEALEGQEVQLNWALEGNHLSLEGRRDTTVPGQHRVFALQAEYREIQ